MLQSYESSFAAAAMQPPDSRHHLTNGLRIVSGPPSVVLDGRRKGILMWDCQTRSRSLEPHRSPI
jgi:hypothetical protein